MGLYPCLEELSNPAEDERLEELDVCEQILAWI
jgi:hypothetical protein